MSSKNQKTGKSDESSTVSLDVDDTGLGKIEINTSAIEELKSRIEEEKKTLSSKEYSIKMNNEMLEYFIEYITNEVPWTGKESLGVVEIFKILEKSKLKSGYIYMKALPLQASHYFISKTSGRGANNAFLYLDLYKTFDEALQRENQDSSKIREMEKQLAALQQGIDLE